MTGIRKGVGNWTQGQELEVSKVQTHRKICPFSGETRNRVRGTHGSPKKNLHFYISKKSEQKS